MCKKRREGKMKTFTDFIGKNKTKIRRVVETSSKHNDKGEPVITRDDSWREEHEWDAFYKELSLNR